jgi:hypothetical protein
MPRHHAIAEDMVVGKTELGGSMGDESVELDEGTRVEEEIETLARRQLAGGMLALDARRSPAEACLGAHLVESEQPLLVRRHGVFSPLVSLRKDAGAIIVGPPTRHEAASCGLAWAAEPPGTTADIHRFGEQLAERVDNRVPESQSEGVA